MPSDLLQWGYAAGLTARGTRSIDLVVANPDTGKSITIQTKTMKNAFVRSRKWGPYWEWPVSVSRQPQKAFLFTFVDLKGDSSQTPDVFIVPSGELTSLLEEFPENGPPRDVWCVIYDKVAPNYRDHWDVIKAALA